MKQDLRTKVITVGFVIITVLFLVFGLLGEYTSEYFVSENATWHHVDN
jgi:hypothetical protein